MFILDFAKNYIVRCSRINISMILYAMYALSLAATIINKIGIDNFE